MLIESCMLEKLKNHQYNLEFSCSSINDQMSIKFLLQLKYIMVSLLSEEFSSRVAESTRLILVKDGFGEDVGALDRRTDERRKATEI
jgi:hypothetical protein